MDQEGIINKSKVPLIIGLIGIVLFLLTKHISSKYPTILPSYVLLLTLAIIIYYELETRHLRQLAQARPYVYINLRPLETMPALLDLVVQNLGSSPAYDLKFDIKGMFLLPSGESISEMDFIKNGINCLAPYDRIQFAYLNPYLTKSEDIVPVDISVTYGKNKGDKKPHSQTFKLDPAKYLNRIWGKETI